MATRRYYAGRSSIHGKGLFAGRSFRKGERIGAYEGPRVARDGMHVLWVEEDDGEYFGIDGRNALRYLNHSSRPIAEFDGNELYALRRIGPGDEITIDYGDEWKGVP